MSTGISSWCEAALRKIRPPVIRAELALLAILLSLAFLLRFLPHLCCEDLGYVPDSVEYALSALSLAEGSSYFIHINHIPFPPRYSFGYPLLSVV
jgi:hypothetical protein